ncbi:MAG: DUF429 domain-containing protein [Lysobacterales bacterium]|nr:MAG: DUF429 domain-containing protein [Xanthomonadales bacterium]
MRVYGLDFTSAPRREKPIICVTATLIEQALHVEGMVVFESFDTFENFLGSPGPWIAGMDFPFGQPKILRQNLGWPEDWVEIAKLVGGMSPEEFERILTEYRQAREPGDKHHRRDTDVLARSQSPMTLYGVPVAKMFYRGAPLLERCRVNIIPCRPLNKDRYVVEAYPALVARRYIGKTKYKSDTRRQQTSQREDARRALLDLLQGPRLEQDFGLTLDLPHGLIGEFVDDASADRLDSLLCAIQTAWAWTMRDLNYGIPAGIDPVEGWIMDPGLTKKSTVIPERRLD